MDKSPAQVIEEKGVAAFVERLGVEPTTVRMWKSRNRLPRSVWPEISAAFPDLDQETLLAIEAQAA